MNLYHHYKNKPYKYIGVARHSETLGEVVIYETRYSNDMGSIWVRPKEMFFENVVVQGVEKPRFAKVPLNIKEYSEVGSDEVNLLAPLIEKAFGEWDPKWFYSTFSQHQLKNQNHVLLLQVAFIQEKPVAFKLGFGQDSDTFYSWLGGVLPEFRGLGIATDLLQSQHDWCVRKNFKKVQTKSQKRFNDMCILNLRNGFEIVGCHESDEGGLKIFFEKMLTTN